MFLGAFPLCVLHSTSALSFDLADCRNLGIGNANVFSDLSFWLHSLVKPSPFIGVVLFWHHLRSSPSKVTKPLLIAKQIPQHWFPPKFSCRHSLNLHLLFLGIIFNDLFLALFGFLSDTLP